jgi:hypothetical protein
MRNVLTRVRTFYGANPLHLLALVACFALAGYAVTFIVHDPSLPRILIWFVAAVIGHDLVLFPVYALVDRSMSTVLRPWTRANRTPAVPPLNYLRIPALGSGLLLLIFLPGIIEQGSSTYRAATGQTQEPFLGRWLLITAALFVISAVMYTVQLIRTRRTEHPAHKTEPTPPTAEDRPTPVTEPNPGTRRIHVSATLTVTFLLLFAAHGYLHGRKRLHRK